MNTSILIVEDEKNLREKYVKYAQDVFQEVFAAESIAVANEILSKEIIDCVLCDNRLPDGLGIEWIKQIRQNHTSLIVVMITAHADLQMAIQSVNLGMAFFLEKPVSRQDIIETLKKCVERINKQSNLDMLVDQFTISSHTREKLLRDYALSEREVEVIQEVLQNKSNEMMAQILQISVGTVKNHLSNIFQKTFQKNKDNLREFIHHLNLEK